MSKPKPTAAQISAKLLQMASGAHGVTRSAIHNKWDNRDQVSRIAAEMVAAGELHEVRYRRGVWLFASAQAAAAFVPHDQLATALSRRSAATPGGPRPAKRQGWQPPSLYHISELLPEVFPRRRELTPVNLPGTRRDKPLAPDAEPAAPRKGCAKVVIGPAWTHDPRYQCAPGEQPHGAGFVAAGIGRCAITGKPWPKT
jgi:hypothetical protein